MSGQYNNKYAKSCHYQSPAWMNAFIMPPVFSMDSERADWDNQAIMVQSLLVALAKAEDCASSRTLLLESYDDPQNHKKGCVFRVMLFRFGHVAHIELRHQNGKWIWWMITTDPESKHREFTEESTILTWVILQTDEKLKKLLPEFIKETRFDLGKVNLTQSDSSEKYDIFLIYALFVTKQKWQNGRTTVRIGTNTDTFRSSYDYLKSESGCEYGGFIRSALMDLIEANNEEVNEESDQEVNGNESD